jgi:hypothetical protein
MKPIRQSLAALAASLSLLAFAGSAGALSAAGEGTAVFAAPQDATALYAPLPPHASLYTFSDVLRLTVGGMPLAEYPAAPAQGIPVAFSISAEPAASQAAAPAQAQAAYTFSIGAVPEPRRWLLLVSGLALAGWVARRRLGHSF